VSGEAGGEGRARAIDQLRFAADKGVRPAALRLARALEAGEGGADDAEALALYRTLAEDDRSDDDALRAEALYRLARMVDEGRGVAADSTQALDYYARAAEAGNPEAVRVMNQLLGPPPGRGDGKWGQTPLMDR